MLLNLAAEGFGGWVDFVGCEWCNSKGDWDSSTLYLGGKLLLFGDRREADVGRKCSGMCTSVETIVGDERWGEFLLSGRV